MREGISQNLLYSRLEERLQKTKPGWAAQLKMIPNPRPGDKVYTEVEDTSVKAGVLVLMYPVKDQLHLVLTRRTEKVDHHQAQISFPGGQQEKGETLEQTALRETREELGIEPATVYIFGRLTPLYIPPTNYCIYPVVAKVDERPRFRPSSLEVADVLEIPLSHLIDPDTVRKEIWTIRGLEVEVPFYSFEGHKIWGATAMVLAEFLDLLRILENCL
ncbi:MAG: CoA pyrophosphatase [Candidatus Aminicenantes bacterium]|jgi:8-oxo-dGTP pyrophosphatase MutT (NUDIX family)